MSRMLMQRRKSAATFAAFLLLSLGLSSGVASAAKTPSITNVYAGPSHFTKLIGGTYPGFTVRMNCWVDSNVWAYGSNRWFHISALGWSPYSGRTSSLSGFVPANRVTQQSRVPHC